MEFQINGCRVRIGFWFAACVALCLLADQSGMAVSGLAAVAIHESGHVLVLRRCGVGVRSICCGLFDICMERDGEPRGYGREALIALGGPAANLVAAAFLLLIRPAWYAAPTAANLLLAGFNLLPVASLDGGQALLCALCTRLTPERADRVLRVVSILFLLPVAVAGFLILLRTRYNFTLLFVSCYLLFCFVTHADH